MEKANLQELAIAIQMKAIQRGLILIRTEKNKKKITKFKNAVKHATKNIKNLSTLEKNVHNGKE